MKNGYNKGRIFPSLILNLGCFTCMQISYLVLGGRHLLIKGCESPA